MITVTNPSSDLVQTIGAISNWTLACTGIASVWGLFDSAIIRKHHLINQVRNQEEAEARSAISQLNAEGYLRDGSLKGSDFQRARLSKVDLKATDAKGRHVPAILENINLSRADLSYADLRGANLSGAILELANMNNTWLHEANLSNSRLLLTNLAGAILYRANLSGANIAGATFDEKTVLPNGEYWNETINWSYFGVVMDVPDYARVRNINDSMHEKSASLIEEQREADRKLFKKLWQYIDSDTIYYIDTKLMNRDLNRDLYDNTLVKYSRERVLPENHFIDNSIETAFAQFDTSLSALMNQLATHSSTEYLRGELIIVPDYKLPQIKPGYEFANEKIRREKERQHYIDLELMGELLKQHSILVKAVKLSFPDAVDGIDLSGQSRIE